MTPRAARVIAEVSELTRVPVAVILGPSRLRPHAYARHQAMARVRALVKKDGEPVFSYPAIGKIFKRDHSSVMHAICGHNHRNGAFTLEFPPPADCAQVMYKAVENLQLVRALNPLSGGL